MIYKPTYIETISNIETDHCLITDIYSNRITKYIYYLEQTLLCSLSIKDLKNYHIYTYDYIQYKRAFPKFLFYSPIS